MMARVETELERGNKAAELLRNPIFSESFEVLKDYYQDSWQQTDPNDVEARERIYVAINVLADIRRHIESVMTTGKMASEQIDATSVH
tara:strand:- start:51 stop:314 length:264 start_codon:yes stop_codon:yes gene_type:complete